MLTGTLVTVAGFLPIATAQSSTGEYTRSIFQVTVIALYPGRAPEEVEKQVTLPIEVALAGLPNSIRVFSHTQFGLSFTVITFDDQANVNLARQQVYERLSSVDLPEGAPGGDQEKETKRESKLEGGLKELVFAPSPSMVSYLLAFAAGEIQWPVPKRLPVGPRFGHRILGECWERAVYSTRPSSDRRNAASVRSTAASSA